MKYAKLNADYIKHDLTKAITLLQIGISRIPREYLSEDDVLFRVTFETLLALKQNIQKQVEKEQGLG